MILDWILLIFSVCFFVSVIFYVFNLPVNETGLRYKEWLKMFPKWKEK